MLPNYTWVVNPYSWNQLADTIWIDQPVGKPPLILSAGQVLISFYK